MGITDEIKGMGMALIVILSLILRAVVRLGKDEPERPDNGEQSCR